MRTTLTLDDDVAAKLKAEARRTGRAFRDVVNDALRLGLTHRRTTTPNKPFKVLQGILGTSSRVGIWITSRICSNRSRVHSIDNSHRCKSTSLCTLSEGGTARGVPCMGRSHPFRGIDLGKPRQGLFHVLLLPLDPGHTILAYAFVAYPGAASLSGQNREKPWKGVHCQLWSR